ncbi:MAG TPA: threonine synthase [Stellaceae bacterium]|nr:threonine synthase [Stellaceae bacterium]
MSFPRYRSTREAAAAAPLDFAEVLLAGLAPDGGLYVPDRVPVLTPDEIAALAGQDYAAVAARIIGAFIGERLGAAALAPLLAESYRGFSHAAVAPLKQLDAGLWLLELFHGPTLAFKDYALQVVGRLFDAVLRERGERVTIIGATSGDTGSAAIEACRDRDAVDIFILYPRDRISEVQRRQMTTVPSANVHAIAIDGTFDDCQDLVKAMFADAAFRDAHNLSAVNSINWARILAQTVYYFAAAVALGAPRRDIAFAVPTGNFGNVYAAHIARRMGLPVAALVIGTNRNDILARFFATGRMTIGTVEPSLSPSMDIQVSSNFERFLFELKGGDGAAVAAAMRAFRATGTLPASAAEWREATRLFASCRVDDEETRATIAATWRRSGELLDPHSAVAVAAARMAARQSGAPIVALACAHPAKFPDAVEAATGIRPSLPPILADLMERQERVTLLPNDLNAVEEFVRAHARPVEDGRRRRAGGAA